ncbi:MAG: YcaO-like family protein [Candidatus Omnitrophica bacterium]|nr:YcaO-like family protein [Candidatus Omnitrophota bacterium]
MHHGKDTSPQKTIRKIKIILKSAGLSIKEASWKNPVPNVWSVHIHEKHCRPIFVNGKGATKTLALASALGEFMERIITGYSFSEFALVDIKKQNNFIFSPDEKLFLPKKGHFPKGLLTKDLIDLYNITGELEPFDFIDRMSVGTGKDIIFSLPFQRVRDKKTVYFPIGILDNIYASNGMSAGNTKEESLVQALSEIFERYAKNTIIRKCIALPDIPKSYYASYEHINKAIEAIQNAGFRVLIKDASLGGKFPVVNVTIVEKKSKKSFLAFGAHPSFEIALTRTVTELLQGQKIRSFRGLKKPNKNKRVVQNHANIVTHFIDSSGEVSVDFFNKKPLYKCKTIDSFGTREEEELFLLSIFERFKKDVYVNTVSAEGFYVCRVLVPGWSEVYPMDDLVYANNNRGRRLVNYVSRLPLCTNKELNDFLILLDDSTVGDHEIVADVLGIALDENSPWKRLCFGELKLLILSDDGKNVFKKLFSSKGEMIGTKVHKKILKVFTKSRVIIAHEKN